MGLFDPAWKKSAEKAERAANAQVFKTLSAIVRECEFPRARTIAYWQLQAMMNFNDDRAEALLTEMLEKAPTAHDRCMAADILIQKLSRDPQRRKDKVFGRCEAHMRKEAADGIIEHLQQGFRFSDTIFGTANSAEKLRDRCENRHWMKYIRSEGEVLRVLKVASAAFRLEAVRCHIDDGPLLLRFACNDEDAEIADAALSRLCKNEKYCAEIAEKTKYTLVREHAVKQLGREYEPVLAHIAELGSKTAAKQLMKYYPEKYAEKYLSVLDRNTCGRVIAGFTAANEPLLLRLAKNYPEARTRLLDLFPEKYAATHPEYLSSSQLDAAISKGAFTEQQLLELARKDSFSSWEAAAAAMRESKNVLSLIRLFCDSPSNSLPGAWEYTSRHLRTMLQYLNETDYVSLLTGDLKNKTVVIQAAKGTTGRIVSLSNRISLLNNAYESIANEVENHFSHEEMKEYCLAQSPKDRIGKQPWFIKGFLKELSDASALDAQFLAELITPCVLPKKCDELADDYSMPGIVLCKYLPECPSAADYAECYRPYTETKAVLPALKGLEKIVPDRIADYCAPGCVQKLAYIMKTKDYYEAQSAAHFLKLLYHAGYSKDEIMTHRGFSKNHTDYGNRECTLHEDTPAFTFEL